MDKRVEHQFLSLAQKVLFKKKSAFNTSTTHSGLRPDQEEEFYKVFRTAEGMELVKKMVDEHIQANLNKMITEDDAKEWSRMRKGDQLLERLQEKLMNKYSQKLRKIFKEISFNSKGGYKPMTHPNYLVAKYESGRGKGANLASGNLTDSQMLIQEEDYHVTDKGSGDSIDQFTVKSDQKKSYEQKNLSPYPEGETLNSSFGELDLTSIRNNLKELMDQDTIDHSQFISELHARDEGEQVYLNRLRKIKEELNHESESEEGQQSEKSKQSENQDSFDGYVSQMIAKLSESLEENALKKQMLGLDGKNQQFGRYKTSTLKKYQGIQYQKEKMLQGMKNLENVQLQDIHAQLNLTINQPKIQKRTHLKSKSIINPEMAHSLEIASTSPISQVREQMKQFQVHTKQIADLVRQKQKEHLKASDSRPNGLSHHSQSNPRAQLNQQSELPSIVQSKRQLLMRNQDILIQSRIENQDPDYDQSTKVLNTISPQEDCSPKSLGTLLITPNTKGEKSMAQMPKDQSGSLEMNTLEQKEGESSKQSNQVIQKLEVNRIEQKKILKEEEELYEHWIEMSRQNEVNEREMGTQIDSAASSLNQIMQDYQTAMQYRSNQEHNPSKGGKPVDITLQEQFSIDNIKSLKERSHLRRMSEYQEFSVNNRTKRQGGGGSGNFLLSNMEQYREKLKLQHQNQQIEQLQKAVKAPNLDNSITSLDKNVTRLDMNNVDLKNMLESDSRKTRFKSTYESVKKAGKLRKNRKENTSQEFLELQSILYAPLESMNRNHQFLPQIKRQLEHSPIQLQSHQYKQMMNVIKERKRRQVSETFGGLKQESSLQPINVKSQLQYDKESLLNEQLENQASSYQLDLSFLNDKSQININTKLNKALENKKQNQRNPYRNLYKEKKKMESVNVQQQLTEQPSQILSPTTSIQNLNQFIQSNYGAKGRPVEHMSGITPFKQLSNAGSEQNIFDLKKDSTVPSMDTNNKSTKQNLPNDKQDSFVGNGERFEKIKHVDHKNGKPVRKKIELLNRDLIS